jgi:hypothetical protein
MCPLDAIRRDRGGETHFSSVKKKKGLFYKDTENFTVSEKNAFGQMKIWQMNHLSNNFSRL